MDKLLSIIIPILNEEEILLEDAKYFRSLSSQAELIFVDGGSSDRSRDLAGKLGTVVCSTLGRGLQKNAGAKAAKGKFLLFLHVDTRLNLLALREIPVLLSDGKTGGCFVLHVDSPKLLFRFFEVAVNFRAKWFQVIDGDLGFFINKEAFYQAGQFPRLPYMEDIVFSRRLRRQIKLFVYDFQIIVSSRKWEEHGFWKTFLNYTRAYVSLWMGHLKEQSDENQG